jgi:8-oxo-dGTP pyrophosphatase MutT (NUDIX family)
MKRLGIKVTKFPNPHLYRPNVGIMLLNQEGLVLIAQRIDTPGSSWQMPQGGGGYISDCLSGKPIYTL